LGPLRGRAYGPAGLLKASQLKARGFVSVLSFVMAFGHGPSGPRVKGYLGC